MKDDAARIEELEEDNKALAEEIATLKEQLGEAEELLQAVKGLLRYV